MKEYENLLKLQTCTIANSGMKIDQYVCSLYCTDNESGCRSWKVFKYTFMKKRESLKQGRWVLDA